VDFFAQPRGTTCVKDEYKLINNGTGGFTNWYTARYPVIGFVELCGKLTQPDKSKPGGDLKATFDLVPFSAPGSNYWLIGTDYDTYSSVYACIFGLKLAWIMTRDRYPNREVVERARKHFTDNRLDIPWVKTPHDEKCVYYPPKGRSCSDSF
jgi:hypothetical protein